MTDPNAPGRFASIILGAIARHETAGRDVGATLLLKRALADVAAKVPEPEPRTHRCDESCDCPACGLLMLYAPSTGQHACQDHDCEHAHPDGR